MKTLIKSDGTDFTDELGFVGNTNFQASLVKENNSELIHLDLNFSSRLDSGFENNIRIYGISSRGIQHLIDQLNVVKDKLKKLGL